MNENDYKFLLGDFLKERFDVFYRALEDKPLKGGSFNPRRISFKDIEENMEDARLEEEGFFSYPCGTIVGNNPLYCAGAFYPLDRSSYAVSRNLASALKGKDHPYILDLCAAPGGKSIALCNLLEPGLLVMNDRSLKRAEVMRVNAERAGLENGVVTSVEPSRFLESFEGFFDAVILDAPCSGSGMGRKKEKMGEDWSKEKVERLLPIQRELIKIAYRLLKKDGLLSYSTCSYSKEENEDIVESLLSSSKASLVPLPDDGSLNGFSNIGKRYIPGLFKGEGQYDCVLRKEEETASNPLEFPSFARKEERFPSYRSVSYGGKKHMIKNFDQRLLPLKPLKVGLAYEDRSPYAKCPYDWDLCHCKEGFEKRDLSFDDAKKFIHGEDLRITDYPSEGEIFIASYKGFPLAFAKGIKGRVRNYLPKGLRTS